MGDFMQSPRGFAIAHAHIARRLAQTRTCTSGTLLHVLQFREFLADGHRIGFFVTSLKVGNHTLKGVLTHHGTTFIRDVRERNHLPT